MGQANHGQDAGMAAEDGIESHFSSGPHELCSSTRERYWMMRRFFMGSGVGSRHGCMGCHFQVGQAIFPLGSARL